MQTTVLAARAVLVVVFAAAGGAKLADLRGSRKTVAAFGVPERLVGTAGTLLPVAELLTAASLLVTPSARWGALAALALLVAFMGGIANALKQGRRVDCNCFGQVASSRVSSRTLVRNGALAAVAAFAAWQGPGRSITTWTTDQTTAELVAIAASLATGLLAVAAVRYRRETRSLREDLFHVRTELASLPGGLPVGLLAPRFTLPDMSGASVSLDELCDRGLPIVLVFTSSNCGPCVRLMPDLGRWHAALADRVTFVVVSNGTEKVSKLADELHSAGEFIALIQEGQEVADAFRVRSTPTAVAVASDRRIMSALASGPTEVEELVRVTLRRHRATESGPPPLAPLAIVQG